MGKAKDLGEIRKIRKLQQLNERQNRAKRFVKNLHIFATTNYDSKHGTLQLPSLPNLRVFHTISLLFLEDLWQLHKTQEHIWKSKTTENKHKACESLHKQSLRSVTEQNGEISHFLPSFVLFLCVSYVCPTCKLE